MRTPTIWRARTIKEWDCCTEVKTKNSSMWLPARPEPIQSFWWGRFRLAWLVFTGKFDALWWED